MTDANRSPDPPAGDPPMRVLVVEDDRSQALFAQAILRGAGMQAEIVTDPREVMAVLDAQAPELVLTDLHMPAMSGTALVALIREHPRFMHLPVVFLTGDQDPEREVEVLEQGGDDYIVKPVRPRHLIAAVQNRIRRARALRASTGDAAPAGDRHPVTGLHTRPALLEKLDQALADGAPGAAMLLEIGNADALRKRYGFAGFEQLMNDAGRLLAGLGSEQPGARLSDHAFLFACIGLADEDIEGRARQLRDSIGHHDFRIGGERLRLRGNIGIARLRDCRGDAAGIIATAGEAVREAAGNPLGLALYSPRDANPELANLLTDLRGALEAGTLALAYQPVVAVAGNEQPQFQVLLRLRDRHGALRNAAELVPLAARAGLVPTVDRAVLLQVLDVLRSRHETGRPLRLFVTQAVETLLEDGYIAWLGERLGNAGVQPGSLVLELRLEDALVHQALLREPCRIAAQAGVALCLSHYRHGQEAALLAGELPLAFLKLSAIHARQPMPDDIRADLQASIELARGHGLKVIGPHVEDPQAAASLWMLGIDYIQGNLVQQAENAPEFDFLHAVL